MTVSYACRCGQVLTVLPMGTRTVYRCPGHGTVLTILAARKGKR